MIKNIKRESLFVKTAVQKYIESKGYGISNDVLDGNKLNSIIVSILDKAIMYTKEDHRKTVKARDILIYQKKFSHATKELITERPIIGLGKKMSRKIDDKTYLNYLLQYLNVNDLKQICRSFKINDVSKFKKSELIDFTIDSLTEEEIGDLLEQKELEIISDGIKIAINKIHEDFLFS